MRSKIRKVLSSVIWLSSFQNVCTEDGILIFPKYICKFFSSQWSFKSYWLSSNSWKGSKPTKTYINIYLYIVTIRCFPPLNITYISIIWLIIILIWYIHVIYSGAFQWVHTTIYSTSHSCFIPTSRSFPSHFGLPHAIIFEFWELWWNNFLYLQKIIFRGFYQLNSPLKNVSNCSNFE